MDTNPISCVATPLPKIKLQVRETLRCQGAGSGQGTDLWDDGGQSSLPPSLLHHPETVGLSRLLGLLSKMAPWFWHADSWSSEKAGCVCTEAGSFWGEVRLGQVSASAKEKLSSPLPRIFMVFPHFFIMVVNNKESDSCFLGDGREDSSTQLPFLSPSLPLSFQSGPWAPFHTLLFCTQRKQPLAKTRIWNYFDRQPYRGPPSPEH